MSLLLPATLAIVHWWKWNGARAANVQEFKPSVTVVEVRSVCDSKTLTAHIHLCFSFCPTAVVFRWKTVPDVFNGLTSVQ